MNWLEEDQLKYDRKQAKQKARNLELISLDMASQAVTIYHYQQREARLKSQGYL